MGSLTTIDWTLETLFKARLADSGPNGSFNSISTPVKLRIGHILTTDKAHANIVHTATNRWHPSSLIKPRRHRLPVDHIPNRIKVLGLAVLILQVVGVLPGVDAKQRHVRPRDGVLVGARHQAQGARRLVLDQPRPAAALDARERRVGLLAEGVEGAKIRVDGFLLGGSGRRLAGFVWGVGVLGRDVP